MRRTTRLAMVVGITVMLWASLSDSRTSLATSAATGDARQRGSPHKHSAHTAAPAQASATKIPLALDGSKNPAGVPDRIAFLHFIQSSAQRANPSTADLARRNAKLSRIGLSLEDRAQLAKAMSGVPEQLDRLDRMRKQRSHSSSVIKTEQDQLFLDVQNRIMESLTAEGRWRMNEFIRSHVKPRIKIYGEVVE